MEEPPTIILGIPGSWPSRKDVVADIVSKSDGYIFAGVILFEVATKTGFKLEVEGHDPRMRNAFTVAGGGSIPEADLDRIEAHTQMLYLIGPGGSLDAARAIMRAACGLLKAGGTAVKVESSGIAHAAESWVHMTGSGFVPDLHRAFVAQVGGQEEVFTCGMHNLGLRDGIVAAADADSGYASQVLHRLQMYMLISDPAIESGHTFSLDAESSRLRIAAEDCTTYPPGDPFHNPYGMWRLTRESR